MQTNQQAIENYLKGILDKRNVILSEIEKHPLTGIDVHKIDRKEKLFLGGIRKLSYEIDAELLSTYEFATTVFDNLKLSEEIQNQIDSVKEKQIKMFDITSTGVTLSKDIDEILKDVK